MAPKNALIFILFCTSVELYFTRQGFQVSSIFSLDSHKRKVCHHQSSSFSITWWFAEWNLLKFFLNILFFFKSRNSIWKQFVLYYNIRHVLDFLSSPPPPESSAASKKEKSSISESQWKYSVFILTLILVSTLEPN